MCKKIEDNLFDKILEEEMDKLKKEEHGKWNIRRRNGIQRRNRWIL
jgi:hypothetical protein